MDYFEHAVNANLSETALFQLEEITEGWVAGLSLAAISLAEGSDPQDLISRLSSSDRRVSDYLLDQVLSDQPIGVQSFLLKISLLDRFCAPLCQAMIGIEGTDGQAQTFLDQIERAQLFLIPLDDRHYWFRYHTLFQGMLNERLKLYSTPAEIEALHRRAADWLASESLTDEAVGHLILIQDWHGAACLVERGLTDQLNHEDLTGIQRRLALFPPNFIQLRPGLLLGQAWLEVKRANYPLVHHLAEQARAAIDFASQDNMQLQDFFIAIDADVMRAHCDALESIVHANYIQPSEATVYANRALAALPEKWAYVRGTTMMHLGWCTQANGQGKEAEQLLVDAYRVCTDRHSQYGARLLFGLALVYHQSGEYEQVRQASELLEREAQTNHLPDLQGWGHYLLGRIHLEWNEFELAAEHFAWTAKQRFVVNFNCAQDSLVGWVYALLALGRIEEVSQALTLFSQFEQQELGIPNQWLLSLKAWLAMQTGDREAARNWAETLGPFSVGWSILYIQISHLYKAHILIELETPAALQATHQLLDQLQAFAERTHNAPLIVRLLALRALWFDAQGQVSDALDMLQQALQIALRGRSIFTFFSLGRRMEGLLRGLDRRMVKDPGMEGYVHSILDAFSQAPAPLAFPPTLLPDMQFLLTDRQHDVLELLAQRLSVKEIAEHLYISPSTVRQHKIQIYRKLGVDNKRQAIVVARQQGLIK